MYKQPDRNRGHHCNDNRKRHETSLDTLPGYGLLTQKDERFLTTGDIVTRLTKVAKVHFLNEQSLYAK